METEAPTKYHTISAQGVKLFVHFILLLAATKFTQILVRELKISLKQMCKQNTKNMMDK